MPHRLLSRLFFALLFIAASASWTGANAQFSQKPGAGTGSVVTTPRVRAELVAHAPEGVGPGQPLWLGLQISHQPEWHTYWKNPGDSGLPTELTWTLPAGLTAGDIAWPVPHTIRIGTLANHGYEGQVLLPVPVQVGPDFQAPLAGNGTLDVRLRATWLVCRVECIPEEGEFALQLPIRGSTALHAAAFAQSQADQPLALAGDGQGSQAQVQGERLQLTVRGLPAAARGQTLALFAETPEVLIPAAVPGKDWTQAWNGDVWTADLPLSPQRGDTPARLPLVLALDQRPADRQAPHAWRTVARVSGTWAAAARASVDRKSVV